MTIYEVFYINYEYVNNNIYDEDGFHDDFYDEIVEEKIPVKYFDTEEKAKNYIENKVDKNYYYSELEVE
jgi:hypothetical protein